jgi:TRAP-type C4-dicarboxylate transport system substrate-binding protein
MPIAAPEVYQALERGVLDGVYGFDFVTAIAYKLHEIAPNFYDIGDGPHAPAATIMNIQVWNDMPDDVKKVADGIVADLYGGKFSEIYQGVLKTYVERAMKEGVTIRTISDEDKARAKALVQPAQVNKWLNGPAKQAGIDGAAMQAQVEKAIAKYDPEGTLKTPYEISQSV